jgi:hypothetical protein
VRRLSTRTVVAASLLALMSGALTESAFTAATETRKATLKVVKLKPFTIRGTGFESREKVTVTLKAGPRWTARATATTRGTVGVSFPKVNVTACTPFTLRAVGEAGTRATSKRAITATACRPAAAVKLEITSVVIVGARFRPGEKLSVTLVVDGAPHRRGGRAGSTGVFKVDFGALPMNKCSAYSLTVKGSLGSRFSTSREALPC